jgi:hypothetical protein
MSVTAREHLSILARLEALELRQNQLAQNITLIRGHMLENAESHAAFCDTTHDRLLLLETRPKPKRWQFWK